MRKNIVAGNWKMNTTVPEGVELAKAVCEAVCKEQNLKCDVVVGVPFTHLCAVRQAIDINKVGLAAENCADHVSGAYTGEVSAPMVASTGANYVILGHSERREYYHETAEILKTKVDLALEAGLKVIFCCGESLEQRENGSFKQVIEDELKDSLFHLSAEQMANIVIAYEPIWAIGTGKTATADQAQEIHAFIRSILADKYGKQVADDTTILYGGSCKPSNAPELFAKADIDGGLIGGASLKAADFMGIVTAF
ncbi:MAG: triose-phosphate isomerase [Muribaculaceae bacterium]|nr:triose-phosphate isomerase [Muribaculaceae bacterium]